MSVDGAGPHAAPARRTARAARVLVVDDSPSARRKLALAVAALGHETVEAPGGERALERLAAEPFDLVLLDILMPGVDGFEVLRVMHGHERLRDLPVIVVSGLENAPGAITDAIRLGAVDFLSKAFEPVLLDARIGAALRRKRNRDRELAELADIACLTAAATLIEGSLVSAERLGLERFDDRDDPIGRFAAVFTRMAAGVHDRERALRRRLAMRRGLALLLASGVLFGLSTPLSKLAVTIAPHPLGLALWVNAVVAGVCLTSAAWRRAWPVVDARTCRFVFLWGLFGASFAEAALFAVAERVPASTLSIVIVLESLFVFALAALAGRERASARRLAGLVCGLLAVLLVMRTQGAATPTLDGPVVGGASWMLLALLVPLLYASEDLLIAFRLPPGIDLVAATGLASLVGCLLLAPFVWWFDDGVSLANAAPALVATVAVLSFASLVGTVLHTRVVANAGAVFGSQIGYVITLAGIGWAMLLLGERPASGMWVALGLMFAGLLLVEPRRESDDVLDVGLFGRTRIGPGDATPP